MIKEHKKHWLVVMGPLLHCVTMLTGPVEKNRAGIEISQQGSE